MKYDYDPAKDAANLAKHGVSLSMAEHLEWDTLRAREDRRFDYGESRMVGYALRGSCLYCVVYTDRGDIRRIISLRKTNNREKQDYANQD